MDDISPGGRRMTYAELGAARGISAASAERLVRRRRWPRQVGNDGIARALVPAGEDQKAEHVRPGHPGRSHGETPPVTSGPDIRDVIREAIREVVTPLSAQLEAANQRADRAEQRLDEERARADRSEQRADEAQVGERHALELVEHVTAEASEQRKRGDALHTQLADAQGAERIARDEAAGLRTRLDQLQARGLWARLRNKR